MNRRLPDDVLRLVPNQRQPLGIGVPRAIRSAELRPTIRPPRRHGQEHNHNRCQSTGHHRSLRIVALTASRFAPPPSETGGARVPQRAPAAARPPATPPTRQPSAQTSPAQARSSPQPAAPDCPRPRAPRSPEYSEPPATRYTDPSPRPRPSPRRSTPTRPPQPLRSPGPPSSAQHKSWTGLRHYPTPI
ncbi:hypothetical protein C9890_0525, partial [Perkinsus sp. BL_2016]